MEPPKIGFEHTKHDRPPSDEQEQIATLVGNLVFILQDVEFSIKTYEKLVLKKIPIDNLYDADKRTLGNLARNIQQQVGMTADFEKTLFQFVEDRNILIHRLVEQKWIPLNNQEAIDDCWAFLARLMKGMEIVKFSFESLLVENLKSVGGTDEDVAKLADKGYVQALKDFTEFAKHSIKPKE